MQKTTLRNHPAKPHYVAMPMVTSQILEPEFNKKQENLDILRMKQYCFFK